MYRKFALEVKFSDGGLRAARPTVAHAPVSQTSIFHYFESLKKERHKPFLFLYYRDPIRNIRDHIFAYVTLNLVFLIGFHNIAVYRWYKSVIQSVIQSE